MQKTCKLIFATVLVLLSSTVWTFSAEALTPRIDYLRKVAAKEFPGAEARCGRINIVRVEDLPTDARTVPSECRVEIDDDLINAERKRICVTLTHEWGHNDLTIDRSNFDPNIDHSNDYYSIMYGQVLRDDRVPTCNLIEWMIGKVANLDDRLADLRYVRDGTRSPARRRKLNRMIFSAKLRRHIMYHYIGP